MGAAAMITAANYTIPEGPYRLSGPLARPEQGQLPLRGDLAHIALLGTHLAAHYVIPNMATIGSRDVVLKLAPADDADDHHSVASGSSIELLEIAGAWAWVCCGAEGPAGYCKTSNLA